MINNGKEFLESFLYDIRNEYTGYVDQERILQFINESALDYVVMLIDGDTDLLHYLAPLKVLSQGDFSIKFLSTNLLVLPAMKKPGTTNITIVNDISHPFKNILRLNYLGVSNTTGIGTDIKVKMTTKNLLPTIKDRYYRKPDDENERVYAYLISEFVTATHFYVTGAWQYAVIDYYSYPDLIQYNELSTPYNPEMLSKIKNVVVARFLERIKDERFRNFVSGQQQ
jgi:hypothetical protein